MADYYPLIARAIAGLDPNAPGEARRALYARARTALIQQLRGVQPPLSESEITRERLSLEEAVRKVESEAAQRARDASRPGGGAARSSDPLRRANPRPPEANTRPPETNPADTAARPRPPAEPRPPRNLRPDAPPPTPPRPQNPPVPAGSDTQAPQARPAPPRRGPEGAQPPVPPAAPGVRGFRDITADADDLGRAAGAGQPQRAQDLRQRAVALAGI
ncbi:hypothetical protein ACVILK_006423 [Bradyrhizobium embrapense]